MICAYCGTQCTVDSAFCTKCGRKLSGSVVSVTNASQSGTGKSATEGINITSSSGNVVEEWFYALGGDRIGPVTRSILRDLYKDEKIFLSTKVWKDGMGDWEELQKTDIIERGHIPPQLKGSDVNNTFVWILAFMPIIGAGIQNMLSGTLGITANTLWFITFILNTGLCLIDLRFIKKAGYNTKEMMLWAFFLVPVYLFRRAVLLKQNMAYAITWCVTFAVLIFTPTIIPRIIGVADQSDVIRVKNCTYPLYPSKTLGQMVDSYFTNPKWEAIIGAVDRKPYVNASGDILLNGKTVHVKIQYHIEDDGSLECNALSFDGVSQNMLMYGALLEDMDNK